MRQFSSFIREFGLNISFVLMITVIVFCSLSAYSFYSFSSALKDNIQRTLIYQTAESATFTKNAVESFKMSIEDITLRTEIQSMDWNQQKPILLWESDRLGVDSFAVSDLQGNTYSTKGFIENIKDKDYYKKALNGIPTITDPFHPNCYDQKIIVCATPIYDKAEQIVGVLIAHMSPQFLLNIIENRQMGISGYRFIINRSGSLIAYPECTSTVLPMESVSRNIETADSSDLGQLVQKMTHGEIGSGSFKNNGMEMFMSFAPILNTDWSLGMLAPQNEIFYELNALKTRFIIITAISLIAIALLSIILYTYSIQQKKMLQIQEDSENKSQLLRESKELDKLKTDFFANISHELRTPLNVILGSLQLLNLNTKNGQFLEKDIKKHFKIMYQNSLRLIRLVNNLIDTTKIDAGFLTLNLRNCNIIYIIEEITLSVADYIQGKGIHLIFDTDVEEKIMACDVDKIERILLNLLSNAVKFSNKNETIYVTIFEKPDFLEISVKDTGIGIPPDKIPLLFQRFRQIDRSLIRNHEGSGIGLSLVKSLVEMHEGQISVDSIWGKGTTFTIKLPNKTVSDDISPEDLQYISETNHYIERIHVEFSDIYS